MFHIKGTCPLNSWSFSYKFQCLQWLSLHRIVSESKYFCRLFLFIIKRILCAMWLLSKHQLPFNHRSLKMTDIICILFLYAAPHNNANAQQLNVQELNSQDCKACQGASNLRLWSRRLGAKLLFFEHFVWGFFGKKIIWNM